MADEPSSSPAVSTPTLEAPSQQIEIGSSRGAIETGGEQDATPSTQGATPSDPSSSPDQQEAKAPEKPDWKKALESDADLRRIVTERANLIAQKAETRRRADEARQKAQDALTTQDVAKAFEVAQDVANQQDPEVEQRRQWVQRAEAVKPALDRITGTTEYADLWNEVGKAKMDELHLADPEGFTDFVYQEVIKRQAKTQAEKLASDMAKSLATEQTNEALRNVATPLSGGSSPGGRLTAADYERMSSKERSDLRRTNPQAIDDMMRR